MPPSWSAVAVAQGAEARSTEPGRADSERETDRNKYIPSVFGKLRGACIDHWQGLQANVQKKNEDGFLAVSFTAYS